MSVSSVGVRKPANLSSNIEPSVTSSSIDARNKLKGRIIFGSALVLTGFAMAGALVGAHHLIQHAAQAHSAYTNVGKQVMLGVASAIGSNVGSYLVFIRGKDLLNGNIKKTDYVALAVLTGTGIGGFASAIAVGLHGVQVSGTLVGSLSGPAIMGGYKLGKYILPKFELVKALKKMQLKLLISDDELKIVDALKEAYYTNDFNKKEDIINTIKDNGKRDRIKEYLKQVLIIDIDTMYNNNELVESDSE